MKTNFLFRRSRESGFTLIEALVAFLVMAIGLIAFAQVQIMLRLNAEVSKQRSEAVRIAQEQIEELRSFTVLPASSSSTIRSFDGSITNQTLQTSSTNTTFNVSRAVVQDATTGMKVLRVTVSWRDRTATGTADNQSVSLSTAISRTDPTLAGRLQLPPVATAAMRSPLNRSVRIPLQAVDLGGGRSGFTPPGANFFYVFNNLDASVFQKCNGALTKEAYALNRDDPSVCQDAPGYFISGTVSYDLGNLDALVVNQGGNQTRPALPETTVCQFYTSLKSKGLIAGTPPVLISSIANRESDPVTALLAGPIYALAVSAPTYITPAPPTSTSELPILISLSDNIVLKFRVEPINGFRLTGVSTNSSIPITLRRSDGSGGNIGFTLTSAVTTDLAGGATKYGEAELTFNPSVDLSHETEYTLTIPSGSLIFQKTTSKGNVSPESNTGNIVIPFRTAGAPPVLVSSAPSGNNVSVSSLITFTFDQDIDWRDASSIVLLDGGGNQIESWPGTNNGQNSVYSISGKTLTLTPSKTLPPDTSLTVKIGAGRIVAKDDGARYLGGDAVLTFQTAPTQTTAGPCPSSSAEVLDFFDLAMLNFDTNHSQRSFACYSDSKDRASSTTSKFISYFCVVTGNPVTAEKLSWSGRLVLKGPQGWIGGSGYKVCRYTNPLGKNVNALTADDHPLDYSSVNSSITDQNFLVIDANQVCPSQEILTVEEQKIYFTTKEMQPTAAAN